VWRRGGGGMQQNNVNGLRWDCWIYTSYHWLQSALCPC